MMKEIKPNPFTPKSGWEPKVFVGRDEEIEEFKNILEKERNDHFLVLGDWGIGKTSLLKEFKRKAQKEGIITSLISISEFEESATSLDAIKHLIHSIPQEAPIEFSKFKKLIKQLQYIGVQIVGSGIQLSWQNLDADPQSLLQSMLLSLWDDLKDKTKKFLILLDDVQNFKNTSSVLTILKNVLSNEKLQRTGLLFGLSCTQKGWNQFMQLHHPIGRFFVPRIELKKLDKTDTIKCITLILKESGVKFTEEILDMVYNYTNGHPYELQVLCSNLYNNQIKGMVDLNVWKSSLNETLRQLGERIFDVLYSKASEQERKILYLIAISNKFLARNDILNLINKYNLKISENSVGGLLVRLYEKELLIKNKKILYGIPDQLLREFILKVKGLNKEGTKL